MTVFILLLLFFGTPIGLMYYFYTKYQLEHIKEILVLMAHVANADHSLSTIEKKYINHILQIRYGKRRQQKFFKKIVSHIKSTTPINDSIDILNDKTNGLKKLQILHVLVKVATIDGYLTEKELYALSNITNQLKLQYFQLDSLLAMCSFTSEQAQRKQKQYKKQKQVAKQSDIKLALAVLELNENATDRAIKKAYRKKVLLHHPDRVLHLEKHLQSLAKEEFLKINEAYDLIKEKRGFK